MNPFRIWFSTGLEHILNPGALDHLLFVSLLALAFPHREWKKLLVLISAFTLGHSISLAASVLYSLSLPSKWVEPGIALSILVTALYQLMVAGKQTSGKVAVLYMMTAFFGLIHGLGFSYLLIALLGQETSVFLPLVYFNLGIECGQLLVVCLLLVFSLLLKTFFKFPHVYFKYILVCAIALFALKICWERLWPLF